jgi:hypothetical protein
MYAIFKKKEMRSGRAVFQKGEAISLFGCNEGWMPWLLQMTMPKRQNEPFAWHLKIQEVLALDQVRKDYPNAEAIVVDIKPTSKDEFFVCELEDIYGYSDSDWTPLLWRMKVLQIGSEPKKNHLANFEAPDDGDIVYEFLYAQGSVKEGKTTGLWTPPKPSATNAALLWSESLEYFIKCIMASEEHLRALSRQA